MAFVYRYINRLGVTKYYGLVYGDTKKDLTRRLKQHAYEKDFDPSWRIEYIDGLTRTDADLLETHFINSDGDDLINIAKRSFGPITLEISNIPAWTPYEEPVVSAEKKKPAHEMRTRNETITFMGRPLQYYPGGLPSLFNKGLSLKEIHARIALAAGAAEDFTVRQTEAGLLVTDEEEGAYAAMVLFCFALLDAEYEEELAEGRQWENELREESYGED